MTHPKRHASSPSAQPAWRADKASRNLPGNTPSPTSKAISIKLAILPAASRGTAKRFLGSILPKPGNSQWHKHMSFALAVPMFVAQRSQEALTWAGQEGSREGWLTGSNYVKTLFWLNWRLTRFSRHTTSRATADNISRFRAFRLWSA